MARTAAAAGTLVPTRTDLAISVDELRAKVPALERVPDVTLRRLAARAEERRYAKETTLYRAGDPADGLYIVLAGRVRVSRESATHVELLHTEDVGGVLGEIPVFGGGPFPATAVAQTTTRCAHLPLAAVERLLADDPVFVRFALARLAERSRALLRRIDELTATTITARVAAYVLARAGDALGASFALGMSQEALARELGTAREVIVRALRALVDSGAIARSGRSRFVVASATVLRAMAAR
jgi:CRP-like cAMP-binding protein